MLNLKAKVVNLPHKPGCYLFKDDSGRVLYVGKAKNLKKRVRQYFGQDKRPQLPFLMQYATGVETFITSSELEALFLENTLIKKYLPKYNIELKDGRQYAFIKIDYSTEIPQIGYARKTEDSHVSLRGGSATKQSRGSSSGLPQPDQGIGSRNDKNNRAAFFGPYSSVYKIRQTLELARRIFPYCSNKGVGKRPCFYYHLHRCPGVCVGIISLQEYNTNLDKIRLFLRGKTSQIEKDLKNEMQLSAKRRFFEKAARLRDQLSALKILQEKQTAQLAQKVDWDFVNLANEQTITCINVLKVREGKLIDFENFVYQNPGQILEGEIFENFLEKYYADTSDNPTKIFLPFLPENHNLLKQILSRAGKKVLLKVPSKGRQKKLLDLSKLNAEEYLRKQQKNNATDKDMLATALLNLQTTLKLKTLPSRIECYDISNTQGTNPVGSMVVFVDGIPVKSEYRKFKIRSKDTPDDFAMMSEMLTRRMARITNYKLQITNKSQNSNSQTRISNLSPLTSKPWPTPDLIVIDGGKGQLNAALTALSSIIPASPPVIPTKVGIQNQSSKPGFQIESGMTERSSEAHNSTTLPLYNFTTIRIIGLAKRIEEIFVPGKSKPIVLSHDNPALQLLQRLRDEAHRFAITFHRQLRSKQAVKSELDAIRGIGHKTKKLLKQNFGTVAQIKSASFEELAEVVGEVRAKAIKQNV